MHTKIGKVNPEFEKLSSHIIDIHLKDGHAPMQNIDLSKLLPGITLLKKSTPPKLSSKIIIISYLLL
jgi:hypothetical protein